LYQEGEVSVEDVKKWIELKEKFDIPATESEPAEPTPPAEPSNTEPPKDEDKTGLSATITELKKTISSLSGEMTKLKAAFPRGEATALSHGFTDETKNETESKKKTERKLSSIERYADKLKK
jgi:hypothetical protein